MSARKSKATKLIVKLPFGLGELELEPDEAEQRAAWNLYVELATRVAIQPIGPNEGSLREALGSLHAVFTYTRQVLREAGPCVARSPTSFGSIAIEVLNTGLRPFLMKWHPLLEAHEQKRRPEVTSRDHELSWEKATELRTELAELQTQMKTYVDALAEIAGVSSQNPMESATFDSTRREAQ